MRRPSPTFVLLLLLAAPFVGSAAADDLDPLAAVRNPAPAMSVPPAGCEAPALSPIAGPEPVPLVTGCGSCSHIQCQGSGIRCPTGYTCQWVYGNFCADGGRECFCWKGPLP